MSSQLYLPLVDTHAHINLEDFEPTLDDLLDRSESGEFPPIQGRRIDPPIGRPFIAGLVCPSVDLESSRRALQTTQKRDWIFAAVGVHPNDVAKLQPGDWAEIERMATDAVSNDASPWRGKLKALGETGLDRYWDDAPFDMQRDYLIRTLELGARLDLPVVIHSRDANDDLDEILRDFYGSDAAGYARGVVHSFSGTPEQAERWVALGFYLGFGGFVTYPNKKFADVWEAAKRVPSDRFVLETDCPYLTPHPVRGKLERNEPLLTAFVAQRLADLRDVSIQEIVRQTTQNARSLFDLPELRTAPGAKSDIDLSGFKQ